MNTDREESKTKRANNRTKSEQLLIDTGIAIERKNIQPDGTAAHLIVGTKAMIDFWPRTGKFVVRHDGKTGRGVFNLINLMKSKGWT